MHFVFEALVASCQKERTAQEFHWVDITGGTLRHFERCIELLEKDHAWRFFSVVLDLRDPLFY